MIEVLNWNNFYKHPRFWRHAIPWVLVLLLLWLSLYIEARKDETPISNFNTFWVGIVELVILIYGSFYTFNRWYKEEGKKIYFFIIVGILLVVVSLIDHYLNTSIAQLGAVKGFWANMIIFPLVLTVAFGLKLSYHGTKQLFAIERLQAKQMESELKLLKSQVNPHFLFNTLNNIYSTNLEDHEKANEIILELSDLLRYQLESSKTKFTPLDKEINSIENYIDLERIRVLDCDIQLNKEGDFAKAEIVPLLLLPFVENAFKYGTGIEAGKIEISIRLDSNKQFQFWIKNIIVQKKGKVHSGGIGLENVKKRLSLMYPELHHLDISSDDQNFIVNLKVQL